MTRRLASKAVLALTIVLIASLTTVRARQAWGEQQARSSFDAAKRGAAAALKRGVELGLLPAELQPLQASLSRLDAIPSPASSIFWGSQEAFYSRRARAFRSLTAAVDREIEHVRVATQAQADRTIAGLSSELARARTYDLTVDRSVQQLRWAHRSFAAASSPKEYRWVTRATTAATVRVRARIAWRAGRVSGVLSAAGNSLPGALQAGDNDASAARAKLSLVALFTSEGKPLEAELGRIASSMHAQHSAFGAAVKELDLRDVAARISAMSARVVPAKVIVVSTEDQWAHVYENGAPVYDTPVTTGGPELPTDHGTFHIYEKISPFVFHSPWPPGSPYYYPPTPVDFWMPFDGAEGLHDASWRSNFGPGSNVSPTDLGTGNYILGTHGCVNLPYDAASFVWNWAPVGTTVVVI